MLNLQVSLLYYPTLIKSLKMLCMTGPINCLLKTKVNIFLSVCLLAALLNFILKARDDGKFTCSIFVDFSKAFKTVDHSILLSQLCEYRVRGLSNK